MDLTNNGGSQLAVRVRDEGVGIPPSELKRIFKRFYRIPNSMALRVKGTGLGLFIVSSVAERHGGRAWAESEGSERGSTFTLELPVAESVQQPIPAMTRVLIVEDEQHLAEGLRFNLELDEYNVDIVETGEAAIEMFRSERDQVRCNDPRCDAAGH